MNFQFSINKNKNIFVQKKELKLFWKNFLFENTPWKKFSRKNKEIYAIYIQYNIKTKINRLFLIKIWVKNIISGRTLIKGGTLKFDKRLTVMHKIIIGKKVIERWLK